MVLQMHFSDTYILIKDDNGREACFDRQTLKVVHRPIEFCSNSIINFKYCLGLFRIDDCWFTVLVQSHAPVSVLCNIHTILDFDIFQITPGPINTAGLSLLKGSFSFCHFFYSKTNDLSISLQEQTLKKKSNTEYIWNYVAIQNAIQLFDETFQDLLLPIVCGNVSSFSTPALEYVLISRRSRFRASAHYWLRGVDERGNAANLIETEQIIKFSSGNSTEILSHIQIRGSIPFIWSEKPTFSFLPPISITSKEAENQNSFNMHYHYLFEKYGSVTNINLCRSTGREALLTDKYNSMSNSLISLMEEDPSLFLPSASLHHVNYDYSANSSRLTVPDFSPLLNMIIKDLQNYGVFRESNGVIFSLQQGIFRTNCVDCIDRTNVIQALIGLTVLTQAGELCSQKNNSEFSEKIALALKGAKISWADNGHALAKAILGTEAQRTDVTLGVNKTIDKIQALQKDIMKCTKRYFTDLSLNGTRQDNLDAFTQVIPIKIEKKSTDLQTIGLFFMLLILSLVLLIQNKKKEAIKDFRKAQRTLINVPSFRNTEDVE